MKYVLQAYYWRLYHLFNQYTLTLYWWGEMSDKKSNQRFKLDAERFILCLFISSGLIQYTDKWQDVLSSNFTNIIKLLARAIKWNVLFYSDCSSGLKGFYCEKTCSEFCKYKNCDTTNGACANGCRSGYTGRHCNESESIISSYFEYIFSYQYSTLWIWSLVFRLNFPCSTTYK